MTKMLSRDITVIAANHGNGSSFELNEVYKDISSDSTKRVANIQSYKLLATDFCNSKFDYLFINDAHYFFNRKSKVDCNYFIDFLKEQSNEGTKVIMAFSLFNDEGIPKELTTAFSCIDIVSIKKPSKRFVEELLINVCIEMKFDVNNTEIKKFVAKPFINIRHSINMFVANLCAKSLSV